MPQQISAPTGMPNQMLPPLGLPNEMQQPTGMPPTQMQMPTPPAVPPVEQSPSLFAPPQQAMPIQQPAIAPVFQPPPQDVQTVDPNLAQIYGGPARENPYGNQTPGEALGGAFTMDTYRPQEQVAGPVAPDWKYNSDNTMRSIGGVRDDNLAYHQSQTYDPITGQWGQPGGLGGKFMPGLSIGR
jgi:hypothetical protein